MTAKLAMQNALWDAINAYATACGGDPSSHVYGNTPRQRAVADVERIVAEWAIAARLEGEDEEATLRQQLARVEADLALQTKLAKEACYQAELEAKRATAAEADRDAARRDQRGRRVLSMKGSER